MGPAMLFLFAHTFVDSPMDGDDDDQEAIRDKMKSIMKKAKWPVKAGESAASAFDAFMEAAKLKESGDKPVLEAELKNWDKGKLSDSEMLLDVEKAVSDGGIKPEMMHEGETSKQQAEMLEMDQADREYM